MKLNHLLPLAIAEFFLSLFNLNNGHEHVVENSAPNVTVTIPAKADGFRWNSTVPYAIRVLDREDGNSEYNEITDSEVLLSVRYISDSVQVKKYLRADFNTNQDILVKMSSSNCFSCHAAKSKLIGPSFEMIAQRYPDNATSVENLSKKIITGTTGTWGDLPMPPHPDLEIENVQEIVRWILKNGADPDQNYFTGTQGAFRTKEKSGKDTKKSVYILTATYTDRGEKGMPNTSKTGQHTLMLKNRD